MHDHAAECRRIALGLLAIHLTIRKRLKHLKNHPLMQDQEQLLYALSELAKAIDKDTPHEKCA